MAPKHSPLPWRVDTDGTLWDANDEVIVSSHDGTVYEREDAALIVRACNSHAALVEALRVAEDYVHMWMESNTSEKELRDLEQIEAALALADPGPETE